jgi:hypothetical protein
MQNESPLARQLNEVLALQAIYGDDIETDETIYAALASLADAAPAVLDGQPLLSFKAAAQLSLSLVGSRHAPCIMRHAARRSPQHRARRSAAVGSVGHILRRCASAPARCSVWSFRMSTLWRPPCAGSKATTRADLPTRALPNLLLSIANSGREWSWCVAINSESAGCALSGEARGTQATLTPRIGASSAARGPLARAFRTRAGRRCARFALRFAFDSQKPIRSLGCGAAGRTSPSAASRNVLQHHAMCCNTTHTKRRVAAPYDVL